MVIPHGSSMNRLTNAQVSRILSSFKAQDAICASNGTHVLENKFHILYVELIEILIVKHLLNSLKIGQPGAQIFEQNSAKNIQRNKCKYIPYRLSKDKG
jgi:hypothetical protein